jgi:ubiquitin C-terminal hydrolase
MDLFQGQLCSSVTCNVCGNVSKTFDPFTSLSLPLPVKHDITVIVTMVRRMPRLSAVALNRALAADTTYASVANRFLTAQM